MTAGALLVPVHDLSTVVDDALAALGGSGTVAVLPLGPLTVATVSQPRLTRRATPVSDAHVRDRVLPQ